MRGDAVLAADPALQKQLDAYVEHSKVLAMHDAYMTPGRRCR